MAAKKQAAKKDPWTWRASAVVVVAVTVGLVVGVALTNLLPDGGLFAADRARFHLAKDSAEALADAADIADGDDVGLNGVGALARVLLWLEHGAPDETRAAAENLLAKASGPARTSSEGLYARALLASLPTSARPLADAKIDDDLNTAKTTSWVLLGRALRTGDMVERRSLVEKAALGKDPTPHATHVLARTLLAQGDVVSARAALDRLFRLDDKHAAGAVTALVAGVIEEATLPPSSTKKQREKGQGPPKPGQEAALTADEARAKDLVDDGLAAGDEDILAVALLAAELVRRGEPDKDTLEKAQEAATRSSQSAERLLEIFLLEGDADAADAVVKGLGSVDRLPLLVDVSRSRFLRAIPDEERRAMQKRPREASAKGWTLPLGTLGFAFSHTGPGGDDVVDLGAPWWAMPDTAIFPEQRYRQLIAAVDNGTVKDKIDVRLAVIEKLGLAERAVARGDLGTALTLVQQARDKAGADADVALVDAAIRLRQNDLAGVKAALDVAVAAAQGGGPDDGRVLLRAARLQIESDNPFAAKKTLAAFKRLGLKSGTAQALEAMIEARSGDVAAARAALAEAKKLSDDDDVLLLRATVMANRTADVAEARRAADVLLAREGEGHSDVGGGDIIGAWLAEAAYRKGENPRAEAALKAIVDAKPGIGEAHLFYALTLQFNPARKKEAYSEALKALDKIPSGPLVEEAKRLAIVLKKK